MFVLVLIAKIGEEASGAGGWGASSAAATSAAVDTVAAALPMDHG